MRRTATLSLVLLVLVGLAGVGCRREYPQQVLSEPHEVLPGEVLQETFGRAYTAEASIAAASQLSCGQLAHALRVEAGCFNRGNLGDVPPSGGSCAPTWDCACCFLHGIPADASEELLASLMARHPEEVREPQEPVYVAPAEVFEEFVEVPRDRDRLPVPVIKSPREWQPLAWDMNRALTVTGILLLPFAVAVFALESHSTQGGWGFLSPLLGAVYVVLFGVAVTHIWFPLTGFQIPLPADGNIVTGIRVFLLLLFVVGTYLVRSSQVRTKEDIMGYILLVLTGTGLWWAYSLGSILPITVVL